MALEHLKVVLGKDLERVKKVLEKRIPAYSNLYAAAAYYYRALAPLETGNFHLDAIESAETRMKGVEGDALFVVKSYNRCWSDFWLSARRGKETVNKSVPSPEERKNYWSDLSNELTKHLNEMKAISEAIFDGNS